MDYIALFQDMQQYFLLKTTLHIHHNRFCYLFEIKVPKIFTEDVSDPILYVACFMLKGQVKTAIPDARLASMKEPDIFISRYDYITLL